LTISEKKERLSILRDWKSEFEKMTRFVIIESVLQKWIEWLWSTKLIAEILSFYLGLWERSWLTNDVFRFNSAFSMRYHFCESGVRGYTSTSRITSRNRYFILSSPLHLHLHLNLHPRSTLTGKHLKNSYRSSPQLRFLLLNLNSSRILVWLFWVMRYCIIFWEVGWLFEDLNVFWWKVPESKWYRESRLSARSADRRL
jgi:hypothetical protein